MVAAFTVSALISASAVSSNSGVSAQSARKPNILFVIMDDVGIDQLKAMGYGGATPPRTPTIDAIASNGLRFRNTWSQPECSNGRMALLTGRYPFRTNIYQAIGQDDLANSQVSPYDVTVARMLKKAGYKSGLFGKYHLGGPENNQFGNGAPGKMGWDFFYGWIGGVPASIDTTAGGIGAPGTYPCGYVPSVARQSLNNGADSGACYIPRARGNYTCSKIVGDTLGDSPGLACMNIGGILVPSADCEATAPAGLNFLKQNAHYVSPLVINDGGRVFVAPLDDPRARIYRSSIEVSAAIQWINKQQQGSAPWMATVSFSADHTPLQTPPGHLLSRITRDRLQAEQQADSGPGTDCTNIAIQRLNSDAMIEAMDSELGRLLVSTGIAQKNTRKQLVYDPSSSNTLIVIIGDNGSYGTTVQAPFDATRAKATAFQTGVWVPLIVAGPMVQMPNRDVPYIVSGADVFGLFGEVAGLDPQKAAAPRKIDAMSMLAYLTNPQQTKIRRFNFTQGDLNIQKGDGHNPPCVIGASATSGSCTQTPLNKGVCEDNGGTWWGPGASDPTVNAYTSGQGVKECWQVNQAIYKNGGIANQVDMSSYPQSYYGARDDRFKITVSNWLEYDPDNDRSTSKQLIELYEVNENPKAATLKLDRDGQAIYSELNGSVTVDKTAQVTGSAAALRTLTSYATQLMDTQPACPGDGNGDLVVDAQDLKDYAATVRRWDLSSTFDFNHDGFTNETDRQTIRSNLPTTCR